MTRTAQTFTSADLGRYGLNHSLDVELYMQSPAGKAISTLLMKEIAMLESIEQAAHTNEHLAQIKRHRLIISLFLGLIEEKAHAKQQHKHAQQEISRMLQQERDKEQEDEEEELLNKNREYAELIAEAMTICDAALESIEPELKHTHTDILHAEEELLSLGQTHQEIQSRYENYHDVLNEIDYNSEPHFKAQVKEIETQMSSYALITSKLLNEGKEIEAAQQQEKTYALRMKAEMLNRLHNARTQDRQLFNRQAERVHSLGEADFFIPKDKQLKLEAGQYHLYPRAKEWSALSQKERHDAQRAFRETSKDIMSMKMQLQLRRSQELSLNQQKQTALTVRRENLKQEQQVLNNLLTKVQDTRLTLQQMLRPTPGMNQSNVMKQRQLIQQLSMAIRPNGNPMAIQQLIAPQNTGSTAPTLAPSPFSTTPTLKRR